MSSKTNELVRNLTEAIVNTGKKKTSPYDTSATVMKVEGGKAYVHIPGGVDETPADLTINANPGDTVQVRVAGGRAFLIGNRTSPPTDDATAIAAGRTANVALGKAVDAINANLVTTNTLIAQEAEIEQLYADKADVIDLTATNARISTLEADHVSVDDLEAAEARIGTLEADHVTVSDFQAEQAKITNLQTTKADITTLEANYATITNLNTAIGRIGVLEADHVSIDDLEAAEARIGSLEADHVSTTDLTAATARIGALEADHVTTAQLEAVEADIESLEATKADVTYLEANYAEIDLANVNNAWIQNGVIKNGSIADAQIIGVSANKLTAGTIDASNITVTNLNADNITAGTLNGQRIGTGSLSLDKLSEDVYTESEVDAKLATMQSEIDGAIETYTGSVVPTLNNTPASGWTTTADRDKHVGDVYYVVNSGNQADGYCYRFTKSSNNTYSWVLIKDSDVTAALQRLIDAEGDISDLQTFESTTSSWISNTDTELNSLKSRTTAVETGLGDKVSTSTFNELSQTVDENSASITSLTTTVASKADSSTVTTLSNTVNSVSQKADANEASISSLTTTVASKADSSTVTTLTNTVNSVSQTVDSNSSKISSLTTTLGTNADGTTKSGDIVHRTSAVEQDLSGFKTTVSNTYTTNTTFNNYKSSNDAAVAAAKKAGDDAQDDLDAYKTTVSQTYATQSSLTQTATSIRTEVSNTYATKTTVSGIDGRLQSAESTISDHTTSIEENAEAIALKANASDVYTKTQTDGLISTEVTNRNAAITASASAITSSVAETYATISTVDGIDDRLETAESTITQHADEIESKVSKNGIISTINQSPESVVIDAMRINVADLVIEKDSRDVYSMHTAGKNTVNSGTPGMFVDAEGHFAVGTDNDYLMLYQDTNGDWHMAIKADDITFGGSSLASQIETIQNDIVESKRLQYDHLYEYSGTNVIFTAYLYDGANLVTTDYPPQCFIWYLKTETGMSYLSSGYTLTVSESLFGYGATIVGRFEDEVVSYLVDSNGNQIVDSSGNHIVTHEIY